MSFITRRLKQTATYWAVSGTDSSGDPSFSSPTSIKVRWEQRTVVFTRPNGEEASSHSVVFVKEDMVEGDFLFLGTSAASDPTSVVAAKEIQGWSKIPQLVGSEFERRAFL